nr:LysR family transcriptional regulator [Streptomyces monashensis]
MAGSQVVTRNEHGSLTSAAHALRLTPAAVTQQVARAEREWQVPLVLRGPRGATLTEAGALLAVRGRTVDAAAQQTATDMGALLGHLSLRLRVGAFQAAALHLVPPALTALRHRHPDADVSVVDLASAAGWASSPPVGWTWRSSPSSVPPPNCRRASAHTGCCPTPWSSSCPTTICRRPAHRRAAPCGWSGCAVSPGWRSRPVTPPASSSTGPRAKPSSGPGCASRPSRTTWPRGWSVRAAAWPWSRAWP